MSKIYQEEIKKIVRQIIEKYKPEKIYLFGSFAYGKPEENSDLDLLVIKATKERFGRRLIEVAKLVKSFLGTDILVYTPAEWEKGRKENYFLKEISKNGELIYAK